LLAKGRTVFFGPRGQALPYFADLGYNCPDHYNPAEFLIEITSTPDDEPDALARVQSLIDAWEKREASGAAWPAAPATEAAKAPAEELTNRKTIGQGPDATSETSWCREMVTLYKKHAMLAARDPMLTKARFAQTVIMGIIIGLVYLNMEDGQASVQDRNGAVFLLVVNQCMMGIFGVLQTFPQEKFVVKREVESGLYRPSTYFIAKVLADLPFQVFFPALFVTMTFWMVGLGSAWQFVQFLLCVVLASNAAMGMAYLISAMAPSIGIALAMGPLLVMPFMIFGGLFVNNESCPPYYVWLQAISFIKYGYSCASIVVWTGVEIECDMARCPYSTGEEVLDMLKQDPDYFMRDVWILVGMTFGYRFLAFLALAKTLKATAD
jgi:ABC-type multidrug transport system permease subunit